MSGKVPVRVEVFDGNRSAVGTVYVAEVDAKHICGSHGFGAGENDRCRRCEADEHARDIARRELAAAEGVTRLPVPLNPMATVAPLEEDR